MLVMGVRPNLLLDTISSGVHPPPPHAGELNHERLMHVSIHVTQPTEVQR